MNINFKFSKPYEFTLNPEGGGLTHEKIHEATGIMTQFWKSEGDKIQKAFEEITGLKFKEVTIPCYLNSETSLSDPLSLKIEDYEDMKDCLIHELCHIFFEDNYENIEVGWRAMFKQFSEETFLTKVHIGVHSLHYLIAQKIMPGRISFMMSYSKNPAYVKSWEIIKEKTPEYFINLIKS